MIEALYYNYFIDIIEQETGLNRSVHKIQQALATLAKDNNPNPFLALITDLIDKDLSLRDALGFDEKHLKMLMIPYLSLSASHYVKREPEWQNGFIDMLLLKRPNVTTKYNFIIELKYVKKAEGTQKPQKGKESPVQKVEKEARAQINKYLYLKTRQL